MAKGQPFFISTAIPYVNAKPHLGFALEVVQADAIARYRRLKGDDVFFLTGTDENALKNVLTAQEEKVPVEELVKRNAEAFRGLRETLNLSWDDFIRTTEPRHFEGAQKFWQAAGKDIYKKAYRGLYCVGCEEFKTPKDLIDGRCPEHPNLALQEVEEENYFFRLSAYQRKLEELIESGRLETIPETRKNEMLAFVKQGLQDFSVSRSVERARGWGVPVPGDESQIQYVWFDALTNYVNALGYAEDSELFRRFWQENGNIAHLVGKGVARFHAIYWPAMLLSAGLNLPKQILVHGYLTVGGQKISKSLGNAVLPEEVVAKYGADSLRYYLLRHVPTWDDSDFDEERLRQVHNADLANGLGNFAARTLALAEKIGEFKLSETKLDKEMEEKIQAARKRVNDFMEKYQLNGAVAEIWRLLSSGDEYVNREEPWREGKKDAIYTAVVILDNVAGLLAPFLPGTSEKITACIRHTDGAITASRGELLFPRHSNIL